MYLLFLDRQVILTKYKQLQRGLLYFTGLSILVMSVLLVTNIALRFTEFTVLWVAGVAQLLLVYVVFLPLGYLEVDDRHIQVNYFYNKAPDGVQHALDYGIRVLGLVVVVITLVSSVQALQLFGGRSSASGIPSVLVFLPAVVGMILLTVEYLRRLLIQIRDDLW